MSAPVAAALTLFLQTTLAVALLVAPAQNPGATVVSAAPAGSSTDTSGGAYSQVTVTPAGGAGVTQLAASKSRRYLVASFPNMKQVSYCQLPDNVWRPLVIGIVTSPKGVAVDSTNFRLFVADPDKGMIYWYTLGVREDGLLVTTGQQFVAVEGFAANWLSVSSLGDLYFTGKAVVVPPASSYDAVFRQDATKIALHNPSAPTEVLTRSNTGNPNPKVWMPSGIVVDSFYIYWGNEELGTTHGSVNRGSRQNVGNVWGVAGPKPAQALSLAHTEVRGVTATGTNIYYLTPEGVFGLPKTAETPVTDASEGRVAGIPAGDTNAPQFDPQSIAYDGDGTAYFTDSTAGVVYSIPALDLRQHDLLKFVDAPGVWGMAIANFAGVQSSGTPPGRSMSSSAFGVLSLLSLALVFCGA